MPDKQDSHKFCLIMLETLITHNVPQKLATAQKKLLSQQMPTGYFAKRLDLQQIFMSNRLILRFSFYLSWCSSRNKE